ncbi:MAG TPA: flagellar basal body rod protein FlgB [Chloroflexota bacterium]|nr:flagellar basal body rod protein FlgB [Chloroflexota bacterium]
MSLDLFGDLTMQGMEFALNSLSDRMQVLANNIANSQTPGYQAQDVSFEGQLASILNGEDTATPMATGQVVNSPDVSTRIDGNTVGMDSEMGRLSETVLMYNALTQLTTDRLGILKNAITG